MTILGVDLSTRISGYAVIDDSGELVLCEDVDTRRISGLYESAYENAKKLNEIDDEFGLDEIYIEENLQTFKTGFSSAQVLSTLAKMNGIVSWHCWKEFDMKPNLINPRTARKEAGLKMTKDKKEKMRERLLKEGKSESYAKGKRVKMIVHEFVQKTEPNFEFEWTRSDNPRPASFDRADACIVARAGEKR